VYSVVVRKWLLALWVLGLVLMAGLAVACHEHERGYLSPQFTPDGRGVVVVVRDARAFVVGFGFETFTPPARSLVLRDRVSIVTIDLDRRDHRVDVTLPPSPFEGTWLQVYRPGLFGSVDAHLRWADGRLEYEVGVTRHTQPQSQTFVARRRWDPAAGRFVETAWERGHTGMGGDERSQLHGDREVLAVRAATAMPCAIVIVTMGQPRADPIAETAACRSAHPDGYPVASLADRLRRPDIERVARLEATHRRLVDEARARGLSEGDAALDAIRGMQRLGLYPKPSTLVATRAAEATPGVPVFAIADEEFRVGLLADIREALDHPGEEVEKDGPYITHRDFDTSRRLNEFLADRQDTEFFVETSDGLWRIVVDYR
jgi:hypothetical protein